MSKNSQRAGHRPRAPGAGEGAREPWAPVRPRPASFGGVSSAAHGSRAPRCCSRACWFQQAAVHPAGGLGFSLTSSCDRKPVLRALRACDLGAERTAGQGPGVGDREPAGARRCHGQGLKGTQALPRGKVAPRTIQQPAERGVGGGWSQGLGPRGGAGNWERAPQCGQGRLGPLVGLGNGVSGRVPRAWAPGGQA